MPQIAQTAQRYVMGGARWLVGRTYVFSSILYVAVNVILCPLEHMVTLRVTTNSRLT